MQRRTFLRLMALSGAAAAEPTWHAVLGPRAHAQAKLNPSMSTYGQWVTRNGVPAFEYRADQNALPATEWDPILPIGAPKTRRNWLMVGNQAVRLQGSNDGTVALFDETYGLRWLTAPDPVGTGVSVIVDRDKHWGSEYSQRAGESVPVRTFGPTWFEVKDAYKGLSLTRTILCPEGETPWLLVHVELALSVQATGNRDIQHTERWALRPRFLNVLKPFETVEMRRTWAKLAVGYDVSSSAAGLIAAEKFKSVNEPGEVGNAARHLIGPEATLMLERLADTAGNASRRFEDNSSHPILEISTPLMLAPGQKADLWFRFGRQDQTPVTDPARLLADSLQELSRRLPTAAGPDGVGEAGREIPWHAAMLTGGVAIDRVIHGHSLDQGSAYSYFMGFNGAARDPLQHALPLVYTQPDLALSVLRNTCAWANPHGELPYALDGAKQPTGLLDFSLSPFRPSDTNLWALWLAAEYAAATGDLAAFDVPLAYHPVYSSQAAPVPLREHLRRQFWYFVGTGGPVERGVGRGERGHVRILNADGNDLAITDAGLTATEMKEMKDKGGSVLNSATAAWVLPIFAGLAMRLGEADLAAEANRQAEQLRQLVREAWNGKWFHRAYVPGGKVIGDEDMWLEVQPWAILCGAADNDKAPKLLNRIKEGPGADSPLGTRWRWPPSRHHDGIWYYINMTLVWAAARVSSDWATWAWEEWQRMTLASHTAAYPDIWEGTLSGPDGWNPRGSLRPGRTWAFYLLPDPGPLCPSPPCSPIAAMQPFPVNNMHSHAQPLLAYLRLLGVEPTPRGALAVGRGGDFHSRVFGLDRRGHGSLQAKGAVSLETANGAVKGGPGAVNW